MSRLFRLLNLRPKEGIKVFLLLLMLFLFITGIPWAETFIESSYVYLAGVSQLSLVFTLHAIFSIVATAVYTAFVDRTSNQKLLVAVCGIAMVAIGMSLLWLGINQILADTLLFALVRAVQTSFLIHWWNYVSDFFDTRAAKRIVPVITSASRIAIIVAGFTIPLLDRFLSPAEIILFWAATLLIIATMSWTMSRVIKAGAESEPIWVNTAKPRKERGSYLRNIREGFQYISSSNYLGWVALSTFLYGRFLPGSAQCSPSRRAYG